MYPYEQILKSISCSLTGPTRSTTPWTSTSLSITLKMFPKSFEYFVHKRVFKKNLISAGAQIKSAVVPVPESEISGTGTPGPDFWSWEPPQGSDKASDDVIDLPTAMKTSAQLNLSNHVLEKERSVDYLSIPLESKLQEPNRNPPLPPFQSLMEVEKVDVSEALSVKEEHELGDDFSAHAAEAAQTLDAVDEGLSYGVNADGSKWWKESGIKQRPDGVICKWTMTRGVSADQVTEWQDKYWEAADEFGHKELGSEKLGRDANGNVWREFWTKSMWQVIPHCHFKLNLNVSTLLLQTKFKCFLPFFSIS
ncbi:hypothetical protein ACFX13_010167 [Malus domestica]